MGQRDDLRQKDGGRKMGWGLGGRGEIRIRSMITIKSQRGRGQRDNLRQKDGGRKMGWGLGGQGEIRIRSMITIKIENGNQSVPLISPIFP
jgi:hypothetical protein